VVPLARVGWLTRGSCWRSPVPDRATVAGLFGGVARDAERARSGAGRGRGEGAVTVQDVFGGDDLPQVFGTARSRRWPRWRSDAAALPGVWSTRDRLRAGGRATLWFRRRLLPGSPRHGRWWVGAAAGKTSKSESCAAFPSVLALIFTRT